MFFFFPPAQVPDFMIGVVTAALAKRHAAGVGDARPGDRVDEQEPKFARLRPLLADVSLLVMGALVLFLPAVHENCQADGSPDLLFDHCFAPLIALYLYGSSVGSGGVLSRLLRHDVLVAFGNYSFEVYLFQWPVMFVFRSQLGLKLTDKFGPETFFCFFLVTVLVSGFYADWIAPPLLKIIRDAADSSAMKPTDDENVPCTPSAFAPLAALPAETPPPL